MRHIKSKIEQGSNGIKLIEELFTTLQKIAYKNVSQEYNSEVKELERCPGIIDYVNNLKKKMEIVSKYPPLALPTGDSYFQDKYDLAPPIQIPKLNNDKWVKAKIKTSRYIDITEFNQDETNLDNFIPEINIGYNDKYWTSIYIDNKDGEQFLEPYFWEGGSEANLSIFGDLYKDNKLTLAENDWMVSKSDTEIPKESPYVIIKLLKNPKNTINAEITKIGGKDPLKIAFCHSGDEEEKLEI